RQFRYYSFEKFAWNPVGPPILPRFNYFQDVSLSDSLRRVLLSKGKAVLPNMRARGKNIRKAFLRTHLKYYSMNYSNKYIFAIAGIVIMIAVFSAISDLPLPINTFFIVSPPEVRKIRFQCLTTQF
ncbi:MAG: hypothetical protein ABSF48_29725, partial [Thermodesulfobacteriota bacterium]